MKKKTCVVYLPYEYYSNEESHDGKLYYCIKDFDRRTKFVKIIFGHHHDDDGTIYSIVQLPGTNIEYPVSVNNGTYKIDYNASRVLSKRLTNKGLESVISFINKYASLYHSYPDKDTIMYIRAYAYNTNIYSNSLPDELYIQLGEDYNDFRRQIK